MDRLNRLMVGGGLGLILAASGCRTPKSEVPLGKPMAREGSSMPPTQFGSEPPTQVPMPAGVGTPNLLQPQGLGSGTPNPLGGPPPTGAGTGSARVPVPARPAFAPAQGDAGAMPDLGGSN